jgi:hypothetical protein
LHQSARRSGEPPLQWTKVLRHVAPRALLLLLCLALPCPLAPPARAATFTNANWALTPAASLAHYTLYNSHPFFGDDDRYWLETSLKFGGNLRYKTLTMEVTGIGLKSTGRDPYGTGSVPAGLPLGSEPSGRDPVFDFDSLWLQWAGSDTVPLKVTLGRQPLKPGTSFFLGDGVYDGFHPDFAQGVYHNPRRWFDAARVQYDLGPTHLEAFVYRMHPTWDGGGHRDGWLGGLDLSHTFERLKGTYALGLFYRESHSNLDNDMAILNLRFEQPCPRFDALYASGELVWEFAGLARNAYYVTRPGQRMDELAWHAELGYAANKAALKPFLEAGYVYYSDDFTPVAQGFHDWGKWHLGNQIDWIIFSTNTRIVRAQAGFWPHEKVKLRALYRHQRLVTGGDGPLSDQWGLVGEWYPDERFWLNLLVSYETPGRGLRESGLANPFAFFNSGTVPVGQRGSVDVVLAMG